MSTSEERFRSEKYHELTKKFSDFLETLKSGGYTWPEIHTAYEAAVTEKTLLQLERQGKIKFTS